jgi:hypothetical protein
VRALTCELLHTQCLILCYLWTVKYNEGENIGLVAAEKLDGPGGFSFLDEKGPPNAGFSHRRLSPRLVFELFGPRIPESLQRNPRKLPFSGDTHWRPQIKHTSW